MPAKILEFKSGGAEAWNKVAAFAYGQYLRRGRGVVLMKVHTESSDVTYITQGSTEFNDAAEGLETDELNSMITGYDPREQILFMWECHTPLMPKAKWEPGSISTLMSGSPSHLDPLMAWAQLEDSFEVSA
jgi:hypothetical protein